MNREIPLFYASLAEQCPRLRLEAKGHANSHRLMIYCKCPASANNFQSSAFKYGEATAQSVLLGHLAISIPNHLLMISIHVPTPASNQCLSPTSP